ncbi:MAG: hypothetical protein NZO58_00500 [Gemmataceae bacterium]|nr:hypothetical protein [Gemmataceae bacterium]
MPSRESISLIVPTRGRPAGLRRLVHSLAQTAARPETLEVVAVIDADDGASRAVREPGLRLRQVVVPPGQPMGALNQAGYQAAVGRYLMLLNDDVVARTPAWDDTVRGCFAAFPDELILVHVNDLVMQRHLCCFPIVSRRFCELAGGICPRDYLRYRIDDHIEDIFNLLGVLGERRIIYAPDVVFEHMNHVETRPGLRQYFARPDLLAEDAVRFDQHLPRRKEIALLVMEAIVSHRRAVSARLRRRWRRRLDRVTDSFALRLPSRQRLLTGHGLVDPWDLEPTLWERARRCWRERGWRGLWAAISRRLKLAPR